ncbi:BspC domain-containing protein [Paenochrobactrum sp. BZR 588]|uniref:BspC domain-containing protein n=1 Tax=Paenochrobactrum TaxID=999488 RepID=UPI0035BBC685
MNKRKIILACGFSVFICSAALAASPPKKSADFNGNYKTLTQDQKVDPQLATCIATGYDLVKKDKKFDRLGFTQDGIGKTKVKQAKTSQSELTIRGQARDRKSSQWQDIALHCSMKNGAVKNITIGK